MSRAHTSLLFLVFLLTLTACGGTFFNQTTVRGSAVLATEERDLPAFSAVEVDSSVEVTIVTGPEQQVVASADENVLPYLRTDVEGDTLVVDLRDEGLGLSILDTRHQPEVQITAPAIAELKVNSSGSITAEQLEGDQVGVDVNSSGNIDVESVEAGAVRLEVSSSGNITIDSLETTGLTVTISSSGMVTVAGEVQSQEVRVSSSGNYEAGELQSADASVDLSSSGNATIWVTGSLRGESSSSGEIRYYGNPASVRGEVTALGGR
jgi:hypothetical protein